MMPFNFSAATVMEWADTEPGASAMGLIIVQMFHVKH